MWKSVPVPNLAEFGRCVAIARDKADLTHDTLAAAAGISRRNISNIEQGRVSPKVTTVHAIAHATGVELGILVNALCHGHERPRKLS